MPWITPGGDPAEGLKLFPEDRKVLPFLDGYRTFLEVMAATELSEVSVLQTCATLKAAGRLTLHDPNLSLAVAPLKSTFFRRQDHLELAKPHEEHWQAMGPYGHGPIANVRILWPDGLAVEQVQFVKGMDEQTIGIPKELMQSWGLPEGIFVTVRPTP